MDDTDFKLFTDPDTTITFTKFDCDACDEKTDASQGFHIYSDPLDKDDDQVDFHLHAKCFKRLLKRLIELAKSEH